MKTFLKENLVLVVGLTLPVLLIVLFLFATVIPKSMGKPPQYEMLFTVMRYEYQNTPEFVLDFAVNDKRLMVRAKKGDEKNSDRNSRKLMLYDGKTETIRELTLDIAKIGETAINSEIILEQTKNWVIDTADTSPDGYVLEGPNYGNSNLVGGLFGGTSRGSGYRLKKGSIGYKVPNTQQDYYYNQVQFIGWVVKK